MILDRNDQTHTVTLSWYLCIFDPANETHSVPDDAAYEPVVLATMIVIRLTANIYFLMSWPWFLKAGSLQ